MTLKPSLLYCITSYLLKRVRAGLLLLTLTAILFPLLSQITLAENLSGSFSPSINFKDLNQQLKEITTIRGDSLRDHLSTRALPDLRGIYLTIIFKYSLLDEPQGYPGLRVVTLSYLLSYSTAREEILKTGNSISANISDDVAELSATFRAWDLEEASRSVSLIHELISNFRKLSTERVPLKLRLSYVPQLASSSELERYIRKILYGPTPYSLEVLPNLHQVSPEEVRRGLKEMLCRDRVYISLVYPASYQEVISGTIDDLRKLWESLPSCPLRTNLYPQPNLRSEERFLTISGSNSFIITVFPTPDPLSEEYLAMMLLDEILAGNFQSMLYLKLREREGMIYSIDHQLKPMIGGGYYLIVIQVPNQDLEELRLQIENLLSKRSLREWVRMLRDEELEVFKERLYWKYLIRTASPQVLSRYMALEKAIGFYWTPPERLRKVLRRVSRDDLISLIDRLGPRLTIILRGISFPEGKG